MLFLIQIRHTGISTMNKKMQEANLPKPIFTNEREDFVVTFYNGEYPKLYPKELILDKKPLIESRKLEMTIPDKPTSKNQ